MSSKIIYFGVFPKTVLATDSAVLVDETVSVEMGANIYYKGNDGNYYVKITENYYESGNTYTDGSTIKPKSADSTRYFKVEPITWKVLTANYKETGMALLLAEDILTANVPYYKYNSFFNKRTVESDTNIYPNNYKYSQIRAYLNGIDYYYDESPTSTIKKTDYTGNGFLQTAFTSSARLLIADTEVDNSAETTGYSESTYSYNYNCENTIDKIFLLSESEVINSAYGFAAYNSSGQESARIRVTTDYAKANYAYEDITPGCGGYWWLRSPDSTGSILVRRVYSDGNASSINDVKDERYGVVPALSISLK